MEKTESQSSAIVVLSGGQDSTTCLYKALELGFDVHAVTFNYGQRHAREIASAHAVAKLAGVKSHEIISMTGILDGTSPLVSDNELEQYEGPYDLPGGLEKTFVPMRNQLFLTVAANRAYVRKCSMVVTGVCEEDYGGYPDCRNEFITSFIHTAKVGSFTGKDGAPGGFTVATPLMHLSKADTVQMALDTFHKEAPVASCYDALAFTHTGYDGAYPPTGRDHATLLRAKGFLEGGVPDPLVIRASLFDGIMPLPTTPNYDASNPRVESLINRVINTLDWVAGEESLKRVVA